MSESPVTKPSSQNWKAVGDAITERLAELPMQQNELAARSDVSVAAIREIQRGIERHRRPRILRDISEALNWPANYLEDMLGGGPPGDTPSLRSYSDMLTRFTERLDAIENRLEALEYESRELRGRRHDGTARE
jgi:transcriptional regulator with XRE-family HTH domain